jgi:transcription elongation factor GreA
MVEKSITLTEIGRQKLEKELHELKSVRRPEVIDRIKRSKDYGDLSENAEYEDARNEQSFIEGRIQEVEYILKYAKMADTGKSGFVGLGSHVTLDLDGQKVVYEIVSSAEADPLEGKISSESPIGSSLVGKKPGDKYKTKTPGGDITVKIIKIS